MIPNETLQTIQTAGDVKTIGNFGFTNATAPRILQSLSDKMYSRKQLAVIREYTNNANDAHIVAGKPTSEVIVTLPTQTDLTFRVRDFGSGLTVDQIRNVYCILGESTKRNSPDQNGVLGYGCKAGFAEADSFTVTSWVDGEKAVYNCIKGDSTRLHSVIELSRCKTDEPSGIEVAVPVKQSSLWTFHQEAANFFKYWENLPTIINLTEGYQKIITNFRSIAPTLKGEGWNIRPRADGSAVGVAFMGGVPYRIDWNVLGNRMSMTAQKRVLYELLQNNDVTLQFKMGEVQFMDSREGLEYTDATINALMTRIESIFTCIKDAIQEKFTPATNIWEAKKIYNAIFGTGLLDVEKGESADDISKIKILEGNLSQLETTFMGVFTWNGIALDSAGFYDLNRFDNLSPNELISRRATPQLAVLSTYRKKKTRVKLNRCTAESAHNIVASDKVAILVNDTGSKSGQSVAARYLIFNDKATVRTVHVLRFHNDGIKDLFYKTLNFDTVPVILLSEIIATAKTWNNANKTSRYYGGGGGGIRVMEYIDIDNASVEESEVAVREIEEGAFYIEEGEPTYGYRRRNKKKTVVLANKCNTDDTSNAVDYIKTVIEKMALDINRVYIIGKVTRQSKWFNEAVKAGEWINLWAHIRENLSEIPDVQGLVDAENYANTTTVANKMAEMLVPKIMDKNSKMLALIKVVTDKNYESYAELMNALKNCRLWEEVKNGVEGTIDFNTPAEDAKATYPYLDFSRLDNEYYATDEFVEQAAKYINAMDLFIDLTTDNTPKVETQPELIAA